MSSRSSSSLHPPSTPTKNDNENNFMEEFCMIAGSHSSTLERLYAWERKLYDEVKVPQKSFSYYDFILWKNLPNYDIDYCFVLLGDIVIIG